ncbi:MAG: winged helix-turn-helix transcriptional regulator [Clostridia bacterium]|nr:winged helix-turn-helix transcriptional regulator [Clostridia bacterium]
MNITKKQFDILVLLESKSGQISQREMAKEAGISVGTVNKLVAELTDKGLINGGALTSKGYAALEPYRVKRAIFMAAGFGSRMVPVTLNTPKPLVRVKGQRIIDTLIDAVISAGIEEIYIVRGYLADQFDQLLKKYPNITFIENPVYNETNNISSAYFARHLIAGSYFFEADLLLYNPKLITKYQYSSNYLGVPTDRTDDWCFITDHNGVIKKLAIGGTDCHHMYGISYWNREDGNRLAGHLNEVYNNVPGGREKYFEEVALGYFINEYKISVRECSFSDIIEIDTFGELKKIDPLYAM